MNDTTSAAIICRVSTREQEDGYSLEAQERLLREYCEKRSFVIRQVLSFSETASKYDQRKKFKDFLEVVQKTGISHIVAEKVDRVSRSGSRDSVLIDEWVESDANRHIHFVKQALEIHKHAPSTAKFVWNMHVAVAKHTADNLSEEVLKAADLMLKRGIWPTRAPIGYRRDKTNQVSPIQRSTFDAEIVRKLFYMYDTGTWSLVRLTAFAEEQGLKNTVGKKIMTSRIHLMLKDPFYIGLMKFRGKVWQGIHEPLISVEVFDRVQARMKRKIKGKGATRLKRHDHMMRGLGVCKACGSRIAWEVHGNRIYAYCRNRKGCNNLTARRIEAVEPALYAAVQGLSIENSELARWLQKALDNASSDEVKRLNERKTVLMEKLQSIEERLSRLLDIRIEGSISREDYELKRISIEEEKLKIEQTLNQLGSSIDEQAVTRAQLFATAQNLGETFRQGDPQQRRAVLTSIIDSFIIGNDSVEVTYKSPYNLLYKAVHLTNVSRIPKSFNFEICFFDSVKIGSQNKKNQPFTVGHPFWQAAWEAYRHETPESLQRLRDR